MSKTNSKLGTGKTCQCSVCGEYFSKECQTLFELATKPCSVVFDAFREDNYTEGIYSVIHPRPDAEQLRSNRLHPTLLISTWPHSNLRRVWHKLV